MPEPFTLRELYAMYDDVTALADAEVVADRQEALYRRAAAILIGTETIRRAEIRLRRMSRAVADFPRRKQLAR